MKRIRVFLLISIIFICIFTAQNVRAEENTFTSSYYENGNLVLVISGRTITINHLPEEQEYSKCYISLYNPGTDQLINKQTQVYQSGITYSTQGIENGTYYLTISRFKANASTGKYILYKYSGIKLSIAGDGVTILQSPALKKNQAMENANPMTELEQIYYKKYKPEIGYENETMKTLAADITNGCNTDYEKAIAIHNWVCNMVFYDWDSYLNGKYSQSILEAAKVLQSKRAICTGYANLTSGLLWECGIPSQVVGGYALGAGTNGKWTSKIVQSTKTNHAWNEAWIDGRWIIMDTCWDSNNKYEKGVFSTDTGLSGYRYFDPTLDYFSINHMKIRDSSKEIKKEISDCVATNSSSVFTRAKKGPRKVKIHFVPMDSFTKYVKKQGKFTFSSKNSKIASVSSKGVITGKRKGKTQIVVKVSAKGYSTSCKFSLRVK